MKILIVEDENEISYFLKKNLEQLGFAVDVANNGKKGLFFAITNDYDLMILDIMMPELDGRQVCRQVRAEGKIYPILMLTVKSEIDIKVDLLQIGADDYMTKPFSFDELVARINVLSRRPIVHDYDKDVLKIDNLILDIRRFKVVRGRKKINLTKKEFGILEYLLRNKNEVVLKSIIVEKIWDNESNFLSNTVETHLSNLRQKIDKNFKKKLIHTIHGIGYKISEE